MKHPPNPINVNYEDLDEFTQGYIDALFFTEQENLGGMGYFDFAAESLAKIRDECRAFQIKAHDLLEPVYLSDFEYSPEQAGHDFWLTRNGHGAGFWDRGLKEPGDKLTKLCGWQTEFPEVTPYVGDDDKIHI